MNRFEALELALELAKALGKVLQQVQQHDRDMAAQLRRAGTSVPSCLSEGAQRAGKDRLQLYRTSAGSAAEVRTQIELAVSWGYLSADAAAPISQLADRVIAITWRLCHPRR